MNEFANVQEPFTSFDAIDCCQAGLEWIAMDDVGRYNFRPRYNFNVTGPLTHAVGTKEMKCIVWRHISAIIH